MTDLRLHSLLICALAIALATTVGRASSGAGLGESPATTNAAGAATATTTSSSSNDVASQVGKRYFTTDTSSEEAALKAKFLDVYTQIPPFDHDGKVAVAALVYSCDGGKTERIAFFTRYSPEAKQRIEEFTRKMEAAQKAGVALPPAATMGLNLDGSELQVKLVGTSTWLTGEDAIRAMSEFRFPCSGEQLLILPAQ